MSRPVRLACFDYAGFNRYFATTCTDRRRAAFQDDRVVVMATEQILQSSAAERCEVLAYCFMPDHLHLLIAGASLAADFGRFMKMAKQRSGWRYKRETGQRLWQPGYHERVLRNEEATPDVVRYIIANPVRAGLVARVEDYPFWGSGAYTREELLQFISENRQT